MTIPNPSITFIPITSPSSPISSFSLTSRHQFLFDKFSILFQYPMQNPLMHVEDMEPIIQEITANAARYLHQFKEQISTLTTIQLQEQYSDLIDMNPHFHPYIAAHLLGESYKRSVFLIKLKELFKEHDFEPPEKELPDHLSVLLKFLSVTKDPQVQKTILEDAIMPALNKIVKEDNLSLDNALMGTNPARNPYVYLYMALKEFIMNLMSKREND